MMEQDGAFEFARHDEPWDEFAWEAFLQEQDGRTERYMELEEKFRGLPDAEERIAREMGWEFPPCLGSESPECGECEHRFTCDWCDDADDEETEAPDEPQRRLYEDDPLWRRAQQVAVRLHRYFNARRPEPAGASVSGLLTQAAMITAKIAGGRSMGFSRDALGGNIASHKRAMNHALTCLAALDEAEGSGAAPADAASRFRGELLGLRERLMDRIVELRCMFDSGRFSEE
jgi:hypothetical protein